MINIDADAIAFEQLAALRQIHGEEVADYLLSQAKRCCGLEDHDKLGEWLRILDALEQEEPCTCGRCKPRALQ